MDIIINRGLLPAKEAQKAQEVLSEKIASYIALSRDDIYFYEPVIEFSAAELFGALLSEKPRCIMLRDCFDKPCDLRKALFMVSRYRRITNIDAFAIYVHSGASSVFMTPSFLEGTTLDESLI